jgi:flotillin
MNAEAEGQKAILTKQAEGFREIVAAAGGNAEAAVKLLLTYKMEDLLRIQVEAIKNVKIDKVTVWDSGAGKDGKNATAGYLTGLLKSVPPLSEMYAMAGMELPGYLGKKGEPEEVPAEKPAAVTAAE